MVLSKAENNIYSDIIWCDPQVEVCGTTLQRAKPRVRTSKDFQKGHERLAHRLGRSVMIGLFVCIMIRGYSVGEKFRPGFMCLVTEHLRLCSRVLTLSTKYMKILISWEDRCTCFVESPLWTFASTILMSIKTLPTSGWGCCSNMLIFLQISWLFCRLDSYEQDGIYSLLLSWFFPTGFSLFYFIFNSIYGTVAISRSRAVI